MEEFKHCGQLVKRGGGQSRCYQPGTKQSEEWPDPLAASEQGVRKNIRQPRAGKSGQLLLDGLIDNSRLFFNKGEEIGFHQLFIIFAWFDISQGCKDMGYYNVHHGNRKAKLMS